MLFHSSRYFNKALSPTAEGGVTQLHENSFSYDTQFIQDEAAVAALIRGAHDQLTAEDAEFEYVRADLYDPEADSANTFRARKFRVCCEPGDISGEATEVVTASGTLHQIGDWDMERWRGSAKASPCVWRTR